MSSNVVVRDAQDTDVTAITDIYNALVSTQTVTWTETPDAYEQRAAWLARQRLDTFPVLVAADSGAVVGFAAYEHFRGEGKWPGYAQTVEHSIHVRESHWGRGIGRALMERLIERAQAAGMHVMVGAIDGENDASLRFHQSLGFVEVARMPQTGHKFGRWLDLVLVQRILDTRTKP